MKRTFLTLVGLVALVSLSWLVSATHIDPGYAGMNRVRASGDVYCYVSAWKIDLREEDPSNNHKVVIETNYILEAPGDHDNAYGWNWFEGSSEGSDGYAHHATGGTFSGYVPISRSMSPENTYQFFNRIKGTDWWNTIVTCEDETKTNYVLT